MSNPGSRKLLKYLIPSLIVLLLSVSISAVFLFNPGTGGTKANIDVNIGVAFCGNTTSDARLLIDRVAAYTNLFVLDSGANPISQDQSAVEEICDYAVAQDLNVIINLGHPNSTSQPTWFWRLSSLDDVKKRWTERWGDRFLGVYFNDEPGGIQLDGDWTGWFAANLNQLKPTDVLYNIYLRMKEANESGVKPENYNSEASFFVENVLREDPGLVKLKASGFTSFTSDYVLHWFDYLGGYDVMLAQLGWNASVAQQIALVKGAARLQGKEWGAIITWKYTVPPYLDAPEQVYDQMLTAYEAGAKYVVVFNYPMMPGKEYGALSDEHFGAIERFWNDVTDKEKNFADLSAPKAVLILPRNYGWGMRRSDDVIWGFYGPDEKSPQIAAIVSTLLGAFGPTLDIAYEDAEYPVSLGNYTQVYYWNMTGSVTPGPSPSPSPSPEPTNSTPLQYSYTVVNVFPHDANAFTEGLVFDNGYLYEGTGLYGSSSLRRVNLATGEVLQSYALPQEYFGEGIAIVGEKIVQLTWQSHKGFVYDKQSFTLLTEFAYPTEGWGIAYDGSNLIMSDGSSTLYFMNPETFEVVKQISVHDANPVDKLNELEYINGKIYANVWLTDRIAVINPQSGQVEAWIDLSGLETSQNMDPNSVLNGIAYDPGANRLFVTGKLWPHLFEITLSLVS
jgi:glutamine cyclotransferase